MRRIEEFAAEGRIPKSVVQTQKSFEHKKSSPDNPESTILPSNFPAQLVRAARKQRDQYHQVREREQPLISLEPGAFRRARDETQMAALREIMQVVYADPGKRGDFRIRENLLTGLYGNHGLGPFCVPPLLRSTLRWMLRVSY